MDDLGVPLFLDTPIFYELYLKVADLSPIHFWKQSATDGAKKDLNIGFQGLALIQGQIYNPVTRIVVWFLWLE